MKQPDAGRFVLAGLVHLAVTAGLLKLAPQYVGVYVAVALLGSMLAYSGPINVEVKKLARYLGG